MLKKLMRRRLKKLKKLKRLKRLKTHLLFPRLMSFLKHLFYFFKSESLDFQKD